MLFRETIGGFDRKDATVATALQALGALSPETAVDRQLLRGVDPVVIEDLVNAEVIKVTPEDRIWLHQVPRERSKIEIWGMTFFFWLMVLIIPVVVIALL